MSKRRFRLLASSRRAGVGLGLAFLILGWLPPARADFVAPYAIRDFTLVNSAFADGSLSSPDGGRSLVLTGPNTGSGLAGYSEATVVCRGSGVFRFSYAYATLDIAGYDAAGYLLNGRFYQLANADRVSGIISVTANAGDILGFRVESVDNTGEPGILTVTDFSFPPSSTVTTIKSDPNPSVFNQMVTFVATVTSAGGGPGGSVLFKDGAATLGAAILNSNGQATLTVATLTLGDHLVTASYGGSSNFAVSTSSTLTHTVRSGLTATTLSSLSKTSVFGQPVTLTAMVATVIPGTGIPTGVVTFKDGNTLVGTAVLNGAGVATFTASSLNIGNHTLTAAYGSDGRYSASASAALIQTVNAAATTTALTSSPTIVTKGQSVTFTASVSVVAPGAGAPTGTVQFKEGAATLGTANLNSNLQSTFTTASLSAGTHAITAAYSGDANFNGSTSSPLSEVVNKAPTATTLAPFAGPVLAGECITLSASTVTSSGGTPTGTVTFRSDATILRAAPLNASASAIAANVCLGIGSHLITAEYTGDANFLGSTSPGARFDVDAIPTKVTDPVLQSGNALAGETLTLEARVTSEGRLTGVIRFYDGYTNLGTAPIDDRGLGVLTMRFGIGVHLITAYYEGDVMHAPSRSGTFFLTIRGVAVIKLLSSANPAGSGSAVVFTASVSAPQGVSIEPTGAVALMDGATSLGTATLSGGQASIKAPALAAGEHTIVASYLGDSNFVASTSTPLTQRVERARTTTALDAGVDNRGYFLLATVACSSDSGGAPSGTVQFEDVGRSAVIGSAALSSGSATLRLPAPIPLGRLLRVAYAGDAVCDASNSTVLPFIAAANAFSFSSEAFATDAITSVFGNNLAGTTTAAPSGPLPPAIEGVSVNIIDATGHSHAAGLYFVSPDQINFVLPAGVPPGPARIVVTKAGATVALSIVISRVVPALASLNGSGSGPAAAHLVRVHADGSQDPPIVVSAQAETFGAAGDRMYLILHGTGFRNAHGSLTCILNDQPVSTLYSGPHSTYPGLDQINLELPATLRGAGIVRVNCTVEGHSTNSVSITVR
jgi:uncharacterized protein (TIGR03437 family)